MVPALCPAMATIFLTPPVGEEAEDADADQDQTHAHAGHVYFEHMKARRIVDDLGTRIGNLHMFVRTVLFGVLGAHLHAQRTQHEHITGERRIIEGGGWAWIQYGKV